MTEPVLYATHDSPVGGLLLTGTSSHLTGLAIVDQGTAPQVPAGAVRDDDRFAREKAQLAAYFAGELTAFDLPLAPTGTPFQLLVWDALTAIPYGGTTSYGRLAARLGNPRASRAVGLANGRNPIAIVIPCHRVVGAAGALVGYGYGLGRKRMLLDLEAATVRGQGRLDVASR